MKKIKITYWVLTGLMVAGMGVGSVFNAISSPESVEYITKLGYPAYLVPFLGVAKLAGLLAILVPGFPRLKEWAYAGLIIDLIGATYSHICMGYPVAAWAPLGIFIALVFGSYFFYHKLQKQADPVPFKSRVTGNPLMTS